MTIVETSNGKLRGLARAGVHVFKAVPYATAPHGHRRFTPPTAAPPWPGIRDATGFGPRALQLAMGIGLAPEVSELFMLTPPGPMSEDCLFLNVWTPGLDDRARRPVMVWLHGGAFTAGSGNSPLYDGAVLAGCEDVVVVTLNHRLGVLGYLYLAELGGAAFEASGNAGMLDIIAALRWVRDNIGAFGGDPRNVTIFGESSGGVKVGVLMAMPAARGLFHKAIIESGPALEMMRPADATAVACGVLDRLGIGRKEMNALKEVPVNDLLEVQSAIVRARDPLDFANRRRSGFNPVVDGRHLPAGPFEPEAPAISADVPLLIGTNKDEMSLFLALAPWLDGLDEPGLLARARRFLGERAAAIAAAYARAMPGATPGDLLIAIASDYGTRIPSLLMAERKAAQNAAPAYVYLFTWKTPALSGRLRSCHALEIPFVFGTLDAAERFTGPSPARLALARRMRRSWARFARSGDPNHDDLPHWSRYSAAHRPTMIFDEPCRLEDDPFGSERRAWFGR